MDLNRTVIEAAAWRLASQLLRRQPSLWVFENHPGGGQYDVLSVYALPRTEPGVRLDLNRIGRIHPLANANGDNLTGGGVSKALTWEQYLQSENPTHFIEGLEKVLGLPSPSKPPASTPAALTYRVLSHMASSAVLAAPLHITMGYVSNDLGSYRAPWWESFTAVAGEVTNERDTDPDRQPGYRFWRCERDDLCVTFETDTGQVWSAEGKTLSLPSVYAAAGRSLGTLSGEVWRLGARA